MVEITVRQARDDDHEAVVAFTEDTWSDRDATDYVPRVFPEWVETDGPRQRTVVADADDDLVGICQGVLLSEHEAWAQGMRVAPEYRGRGISRVLTHAVFDWARERGATVCRNMVFSWNVAGLGSARAVGFEPVTEFRWMHPDPGPEADDHGHTTDGGADGELRIVDRPDAAWTFWQRSDARDALAGLALDRGESWAVSELTREDLHRAAAETALLTVQGERTRGFTYRTRDYEREDGEAGEGKRWAEYGVGAWADLPALRALGRAIARDAAGLGADETRVLIPETPRHVSDAAAAGIDVADEPDFVMAADLTGESGGEGSRHLSPGTKEL